MSHSFHPQIIYHDGHPWMDAGRMSFDRDIRIFTNTVEKSEGRPKRNVCFLSEPESFRPKATNPMVVRDWKKFALVLTHDPQLLEKCGNAVFLPFGTTWIREEDYGNNLDKQFGVSFICGAKAVSEGHHFRQGVWARCREIKIPRQFWGSSQHPLPGEESTRLLPKERGAKREVMQWQFHIAIENTNGRNYFSEKLIDCLVTKTVPIYRGCPNIGDFFNPKGLLCFEQEDELIDLCNGLNEHTYHSLLPHIEENFRLAAEYARPMEERIEAIIRSHSGRGNWWDRLSGLAGFR